MLAEAHLHLPRPMSYPTILEVVSGSHTRDETLRMAAVAREHGLYASCGSDYHGPENPWIELGRLVEVVGEESLGGLEVCPTVGPQGRHGELGLGRSPGGMDGRGRGRLADVDQDLGNGFGIGEDRDKGERRLAGRTDQGEGFIDSGQEGGPFGGPGKGGVVGLGCWRLGCWGRGRGGWREWKSRS